MRTALAWRRHIHLVHSRKPSCSRKPFTGSTAGSRLGDWSSDCFDFAFTVSGPCSLVQYSSSAMEESVEEMAENSKRKREENRAAEENGAAVEPASSKAKVDLAEYRILREGDAEILLRGNDVFYNKTQVVNRDISIAVLRAFVAKRQEEHAIFVAKQAAKGRNRRPFSEGIQSNDGGGMNGTGSEHAELPSSSEGAAVEQSETKSQEIKIVAKPVRVLEALAASGLRALRYAREVDDVGSILALDNDKVAVEACMRNIKLNGSVAASKVETQQADSRIYMLTHEKEFDVVDLDPYGSPSIFLDSAVQTLADGGLLMCTATDMAVLCGNNGEVCYSKYGSYSLRAKYCHEMALRILLATIESHANRYKRHIVPLLSLSVDFYIRVFVRVYTSANAMKETPSKLAYVYQCIGCDNFSLQPVGRIVQKKNSTRYMPGLGPTVRQNCEHCDKQFNMGGPIWAAPIHDSEWVSTILHGITEMRQRYPAYEKIHSILTAVSEELVDVPLYLSLHEMSATLKCTPPSSVVFRSAVLNAGYRISGTHASPLGLKTDAPMEVVWDIMRCWVKEHPVKAQKEETPGTVILSKEPKLEANFSRARGAQSKAQAKGVARFLPNPEDNWGPKLRAGRHIKSKHGNLINSAGPSKSYENSAAAANGEAAGDSAMEQS